MLTTDLALRVDPVYEPISRRFLENPDEFADAFARAWYKLTHRDMGPIARYLGPLVPQEPLLWQDPVPAVDARTVDDADIAALKAQILDSGLSVSAARLAPPGRRRPASAAATSAAAPTARASAWSRRTAGRSTTRTSWPGAARRSRDPAGVQRRQAGGKQVSLADLIVLGGVRRGRAGGEGRRSRRRRCPSRPGRTDATQEQTDAESFAALEPKADGFRNYLGKGNRCRPSTCWSTGRTCSTLTAPEMTVLVGGLRVLGANYRQSAHGVLHRHARAR